MDYYIPLSRSIYERFSVNYVFGVLYMKCFVWGCFVRSILFGELWVAIYVWSILYGVYVCLVMFM